MNNAQRKQLAALQDKVRDILSAVEALDDIGALKDEFESVKSDEEAKFSNLSEGLQGSAKGAALEEAAESLGEIVDLLGEAEDALDTLIDKLGEAAEHDLP